MNAWVWLPWAAYVLAWFHAMSPDQATEVLVSTFCGLMVTGMCFSKFKRWEWWTLLSVSPLVTWLAYAYLAVIRPAHAESACVLCSFVFWRARVADIFIARGNYRWAFEIFWNDVVLPAAILITAVALMVVLAARSRGTTGPSNAHAV
jgi:hypothetical protein